MVKKLIRIVGAMVNLGHTLSDQTVGNILQRNGISPAPERQRTTTWADLIRAHMSVLAGTDFFPVEVMTLRGLVTYYVLFFIHLESRKVEVAGITPHPSEQWMKQAERRVKSVKHDCLSKLILFGETSLRRALREYLIHFHAERNHQGKDNALLFPAATNSMTRIDCSVSCKGRLGGLLKYSHREAA